MTAAAALLHDVDSPEHRPLVVRGHRLVAERVLELVLSAPDGSELPAWDPGAHVEVLLPSGLRRQYSLCGRPEERETYTLSVLDDVDGRGGSVELHRVARAGAVLDVRPPRNDFPLVEAAPAHLLLAGGIGITPIITMVERLSSRGTPWQLVYGGRSTSTMAYLDRVAACSGGQVDLWPEDQLGRPDLPALLQAQPAGTVVYACGPTGMLDAVAAAHATVSLPPLRIERFAASGPVDSSGGSFEVVLAKSSLAVVVPEGATVLESVRAVLPRLSYSCEEGYCGECETQVLEGEPDHRDDFLDEAERAAGETMMICVSRCKGDRLVLGL